MLPHSMLLLFASAIKKRNNDVFYPYRTSSNLLYFTGLNIPYFVLVVLQLGDIYAFSRKPNPETEIWDGKMLSFTEIAEQINIPKNNIYSYTLLWEKLEQYITNNSVIYHEFGEQHDIDKNIIKILHQNIGKNRIQYNRETKIIHPKNIISDMRIQKDKQEIQYIKKACEISANAHNFVIQFCKQKTNISHFQKLYEYEIQSELEKYFLRDSSCYPAYPSIVAAGKNATILHYTERKDFATARDLLLIDAGTEYKGYASDITRTFPVSGNFLPVQKDLYTLVLSTQKQIIMMIDKATRQKKDITLSSIHEKTIGILVDGLMDMGLFDKIPNPEKKSSKLQYIIKPKKKEIIERKLYKYYYMHGTSHFLGLDVHDFVEYYTNGGIRKLEKGFVFTVEPGIYISPKYSFLDKKFRGIGIRIEDDVLIKQSGIEVLSRKAVKEIADIQDI